jgi:hypothetical protein
VLAPFLWNRPAARLDAVALSHPDSDHSGGLRAVLTRFRVREFWENGRWISGTEDTLRAVERSGACRRTLVAGQRLWLGSALLTIDSLLKEYPNDPYFHEVKGQTHLVEACRLLAEPPGKEETGSEWRSTDVEDVLLALDSEIFPLRRKQAALLPVHPGGLHVWNLPPLNRLFQGRDVFAPAAARLARGEPPETIGEPTSGAVRLHLPRPRREGHSLLGQVLMLDRFGNLITNVHRRDIEFLGPSILVHMGTERVRGLARSYHEGIVGEPLALIGSSGHLELAVVQGSASAQLGMGRGARVRVTSLESA